MEHRALTCHTMSTARLNLRVVHFFVVSSVPSFLNVFAMFYAARKLSFHRFHSLLNLSATLLLQSSSNFCWCWIKLSSSGRLKVTHTVTWLCFCDRSCCRPFSFASQWLSQKSTLQLLRCHQWKFIRGCSLHGKCTIIIFMYFTG